VPLWVRSHVAAHEPFCATMSLEIHGGTGAHLSREAEPLGLCQNVDLVVYRVLIRYGWVPISRVPTEASKPTASKECTKGWGHSPRITLVLGVDLSWVLY
jgi:hypothetical protein